MIDKLDIRVLPSVGTETKQRVALCSTPFHNDPTYTASRSRLHIMADNFVRLGFAGAAAHYRMLASLESLPLHAGRDTKTGTLPARTGIHHGE